MRFENITLNSANCNARFIISGECNFDKLVDGVLTTVCHLDESIVFWDEIISFIVNDVEFDCLIASLEGKTLYAQLSGISSYVYTKKLAIQ